MIEFSAWRTIVTAPFKAWIMYWYLPMDLSYHQCHGHDTCQSNAILRRNDSSRSACIGRVPRFDVPSSSGKCWAPKIAPSRHHKNRATNVTGITSAVSAEVLHCGCSHRWGFQSVWLAQSKIGARVVLGCAQIISIPDYADAEYKHI